MVTFLKVCGIVFVMTLIVPLLVAGMSASWRAGFEAWKSYMKIMGGFVLIGGGFGVLMAFAEYG